MTDDGHAATIRKFVNGQARLFMYADAADAIARGDKAFADALASLDALVARVQQLEQALAEACGWVDTSITTAGPLLDDEIDTGLLNSWRERLGGGQEPA